jgi:antitoxin component of RelBE/YafQ-DinJ toxin-antitoxin module
MKDLDDVKETKLVIRIDAELLEEFKKICKKHDLTMSQVLRVQIRKFVSEAGGRIKR